MSRSTSLAMRPACEPKGATYTALKVSKNVDGMWSAACIVDV